MAKIASTRIGLISDTHGLLRPEAVASLRGCARIILGGDVGGPEILEALASIAPVVAVRGNNDTGPWAAVLPASETIHLQGVGIYAIHDLAQIDIEPRSAGIRVVVSGHSHKPLIEERDGVLFVNPGSAGPRRFKLPITLGELTIEGASVAARIIHLNIPKSLDAIGSREPAGGRSAGI
jgi:putative phosphoesterase